MTFMNSDKARKMSSASEMGYTSKVPGSAPYQEDVSAFTKMIKTASTACINLFERFFNWWGQTVAKHPWKVIFATLIITGVSLIGLINFNSEADGWKLWLPDDSKHIELQNWKENNFVEDIRKVILDLRG